jgi:2-[hydroxy(phenyl)methyl]-succinyl-CoA dehydrogenase BbsC subunit
MKDRTALIVGAADGVGRAISIRLAKSGAKTVLIDSDLGKLTELARKVEETGTRAEVIALDPTDPNAIKAAVATILNKFGSIDILINNVDHKDGVPISEGTIESWERSLKDNLSPIISFCLSVIPEMRKNKYGRIVNVGSIDYLGTPNKSNYCTSKSAVFGLTRSFARELAKDGITVNQVLKGDIKTGENEMSPDAEEKRAARLPMQRLGKPEDIAYAVAYLASNTSGYVTGQNLIVCGGESVYSSMSA